MFVETRRERVLALDVGRKRIGLAVSDAAGWGAQGLDTLQRKTLSEDLKRIAQIAKERKAAVLVVGLPLHMDGREGEMTAFVRQFGARLGIATGLRVEFQDERLTSVTAEERLSEGGMSLNKLLDEKRKGAVDRMAAVIILEDYLRGKAE
ncbi:MAG TPA: Holliday junction resolvase RuvX [Paludibaculum sp.]|jgi:putative Holliday junction resolvase